jgi:hypothetical protein
MEAVFGADSQEFAQFTTAAELHGITPDSIP